MYSLGKKDVVIENVHTVFVKCDPRTEVLGVEISTNSVANFAIFVENSQQDRQVCWKMVTINFRLEWKYLVRMLIKGVIKQN